MMFNGNKKFVLINAALDKLVKSSPFHGEDYGFEPRTLYFELVGLLMGN